jgi:hypothetical protein
MVARLKDPSASMSSRTGNPREAWATWILLYALYSASLRISVQYAKSDWHPAPRYSCRASNSAKWATSVADAAGKLGDCTF